MSWNGKAQNKEYKGLEGTWWAGGQMSFAKDDNGTSETTSSTFVPLLVFFKLLFKVTLFDPF